MKKSFLAETLRYFMPIVMTVLLISACASEIINKLPDPSPTAKLRVFVLPVSGDRVNRGWAIPDEEFAKNAYYAVGRFLSQTGIYEIIPQEDIEKALGKKKFEGWQWKIKDWILAREVGKALHADYTFIAERGDSGVIGPRYSGQIYYGATFINIKSGKQYSSLNTVAKYDDYLKVFNEAVEAMKQSYREIFMAAKDDLFETALRKGRQIQKDSRETGASAEPVVKIKDESFAGETQTVFSAASEGGKSVLPAETAKGPQDRQLQKEQLPAVVAKTGESEKPVVTAKATEEKNTTTPKIPESIAFVKDAMKSGTEKEPTGKSLARKELPADKVRLIVYDFSAAKHMEVVSLILADVLREELFKMGSFILVNRENMLQVIEEIKLQHSGLVDEKGAVEIGGWLSANEIVTGKLATLGQVYVLSSKRTDISTLRSLGMGSIKCPVGKEEELLTGIPEMARRLVGLP